MTEKNKELEKEIDHLKHELESLREEKETREKELQDEIEQVKGSAQDQKTELSTLEETVQFIIDY